MGSGNSTIHSPHDLLERMSAKLEEEHVSSPSRSRHLCGTHGTRQVELYCTQCEIEICNKCVVDNHRGHDFILIEERDSSSHIATSATAPSVAQVPHPNGSRQVLHQYQSGASFESNHSQSGINLTNYNFPSAPKTATSRYATPVDSRRNSALNVLPSAPTSQKSNSQKAKTIPFPFYGVSMKLLRTLYQYIKSIDPDDQMTTTDVSEQVIKPWTAAHRCSLVELFLSNHSNSPHPILQLNASESVSPTPTVFVSHAWKYKFSELISAISSFDRTHSRDITLINDYELLDPSEINKTGGFDFNRSALTTAIGPTENYYWIDVCVNNQWEAPQLPYEWWSSTFLSAIGKIGNTCLVLSPWDDPIPLKRAWCLWEIVCTKTTHALFTIQFSPIERMKFQKILRVNFEYIMKAISGIDLESSEAWNPLDKEMIFDVVRHLEGGFQSVNMIIFDVLREWLCESGRDAIDYSENIYSTESNYDKIKDNLYLMNNVGQLLKEQGKYEEAEHLYRLALSGYNRIDWKRHDKERREKFEAKGMSPIQIQKALSIRYKDNDGEGLLADCSDDSPVDGYEIEQDRHLSTTNNLAILLNITGRRSEAEMLFKEILQQYIRRYGDEDKDTLAIKNNLANIYNDKGERNLASAMYEEVLAGYLKILGKENPETLSCMHNLATVWNDQGKAKEAEELMRETLELQSKILGRDHPTSLITMNNLALILYDQKKLAEAENMYQDTLKGQEKVLGKNHPKVFQTLGNLANLYRDKYEYDRAEETYHQVINGQTDSLGVDHPDTLLSMNNLANLLSDIGKLNEAEQMYVRSLAGQTRTIGDDHEETIGTKYNLGILYHQLNRLEEAEKYAQEAYTNYCHRFGIEHVNTLTACHNVAVIKKARDLPAEAEYYYRQTLSGQQLYLGLDHEDTLRTMINLASLLCERNEGTEAEELYIRSISYFANRMDELRNPSEKQYQHLYLDVLVRYGDMLIEKDDFQQAQGIFEKLVDYLESLTNKSEEQEEIYLESKEKLELAIEVNTSE